jgi:hypothetical protein
MATKQTKKAATKTTMTDAAKAKLTAAIVECRMKEKLSFRAIEKKFAKQLGFDPEASFGGFKAFKIFHAAKAATKNGNGKAAVAKTEKKASVFGLRNLVTEQKKAKAAAKKAAKTTAAVVAAAAE